LAADFAYDRHGFEGDPGNTGYLADRFRCHDMATDQ
jgi:hypothetical protein